MTSTARADTPMGPHRFVRFLTGPHATPEGTCWCGRSLFDPVHPDWPPADPVQPDHPA